MIEYSGKSGRGIADRPPISPSNPDAVSTAQAPPGAAADPYASFALPGGHGPVDNADSWCASYDHGGAGGALLADAHLVEPHAPSRAADAAGLPDVNNEFCGFKLVAELGRGAFGRVFLGHQGELADRPVALKVSTEIREESQRLARLQHTNIVPIYSFHRLGALQAVCMPYFGSATLADVAAELSRCEALPASGKMVASTVYDRRSRTLRTVESRTANSPDRPAPPLAPGAARPGPAADAAPHELNRLERLTYVESILWIGARLADGLAHAHERGILHRDLKPANVLLTDDGQPMLLDFNLSEDTDRQPAATVAHIGGTLPYMAPEHLEAFGGTWRDVDARSDVYSLGVILYELLTGRTPFVRHVGPAEKVLPELITERRKGTPDVSRFNKAVSAATEAIIRKCLEPDPRLRYQTARALKEDLDRQLNHLPLLHQPEPSRRERAQKWYRRNSWVRSTGVVAAVSVVVIAGLSLLGFDLKQRAEHAAALNRFASFRTDFQTAQSLYYVSRGVDAEDEELSLAAARRALDLYGLPADANWRDRVEVHRLPDADRPKLANDLGQLLLLLARATVTEKDPPAEQRAEALRLNRLAEGCFTEPGPRALWAQRAKLVTDPDEAKALQDKAAETPAEESWDHYLAARAYLKDGKVPKAIAEAREAVRIDPNSFAAWFLLGNCTQRSGSHSAHIEATVHYTTCESLRPGFYGTYFNRGLAWLASRSSEREENVGYFAKAEADFTRAIEIRPKMAEAHLQRSLARAKLGNIRDALADANEALALGTAPARVYLMRADLRRKLGDRAGAERDLADGLKQTPADLQGWIDRGKARIFEEKDGEGALADFAEAARCNPYSREAIHDQAYVLGEMLKRPQEAIRLIDRELELYPDQPTVIVSRGVYHARLGRRDKALADAKLGYAKAPQEGEVLYRVGDIYALTSRLADDPKGDQKMAFRYLAAALQRGFGFDEVENDPDLKVLQDEPEFAELRRIIDTTRKMKKGWQ